MNQRAGKTPMKDLIVATLSYVPLTERSAGLPEHGKIVSQAVSRLNCFNTLVVPM